MGRCTHHPDIETSYACLKYDVYLCEACLKCKDPEIYCKYRTACPIQFIDREKRRQTKKVLDIQDDQYKKDMF